MGIPLRQCPRLGSHLLTQKLRGCGTFPLLVSGAPMVSIAAGKPLTHNRIEGR